jgi:hypothetical protein
VLFDPVFRHFFELIFFVIWPGVAGTEKQVAGFFVLFLGALMKDTRLEELQVSSRILAAVDRIIFLTALAAEGEGQKDAAAVIGNELLPFNGQVAFGLRVERGVDGVTAADELGSLP